MTPNITQIAIHDTTTSPEVKDYFQALGQFITTFSLVEITVFCTSGCAARFPLPVAQAIFGGSARVKESMDRVNRLIEIAEIGKAEIAAADHVKAEIKLVFTQLGLINSTRNSILHNGTDIGPGSEWIVSNAHLAFKKENLREILISSKALRNMSADLGKMLLILNCVNLCLQGDEGAREALGDSYQRLVAAPWKYKPKQLPAQKRKTRSDAQV